jgi:hypothetical protein
MEGVVVRPSPATNGIILIAEQPGIVWIDFTDHHGEQARVEVVTAPHAPISSDKPILKTTVGKPLLLRSASKRPVDYVDVIGDGGAWRHFHKEAPQSDKKMTGRYELPAPEPGIFLFFVRDVDGKEEMGKIQVQKE